MSGATPGNRCIPFGAAIPNCGDPAIGGPEGVDFSLCVDQSYGARCATDCAAGYAGAVIARCALDGKWAYGGRCEGVWKGVVPESAAVLYRCCVLTPVQGPMYGLCQFCAVLAILQCPIRVRDRQALSAHCRRGGGG